MSKPTLVLDFDGVIHSYTSGWQGIDKIPDPPVQGALKFILDARECFTVAIHSSRSSEPAGIEAMQRYLVEHFETHFAPAAKTDARRVAEALVLHGLQWPVTKPAAFVTLDDRALTFTGTWPTIESLRAFKPWNK